MACGRSFEKQRLTRFTREPDGRARVDPQHKRPGRGAYLCDAPECREEAAAARGFARSFRAPVKELDWE